MYRYLCIAIIIIIIAVVKQGTGFGAYFHIVKLNAKVIN